MAKRKKKRRLGGAIILLIVFVVTAGVIAGYIWLKDSLLVKYPMMYTEYITAAAAENDIPPELIASVIMAESSYRPAAVSSAGAVGLMQIMPETGRWIAEKLEIEYSDEILYDEKTNIAMGAWYLGFLSRRYSGDTVCVCSAYHQGQGTVDGWLGDTEISADGKTLAKIPSDVTRAYVDRILKYYEYYTNAYGDIAVR